MKKYIAIVPVVLGLMLVVSLFTPTRVAHAQVGRPCNVGLWSQGVYDQYSKCVQNTTSTSNPVPVCLSRSAPSLAAPDGICTWGFPDPGNSGSSCTGGGGFVAMGYVSNGVRIICENFSVTDFSAT